LRRWPQLNWLIRGDDEQFWILQGELALANSEAPVDLDKKLGGVETTTETMMKIIEQALKELHKH
jgi:hypothetical protein